VLAHASERKLKAARTKKRAMRSNYNSTKVYFVYFGIYSGQTPDKRKAWVRFLSEVRRRGQAEMLN